MLVTSNWTASIRGDFFRFMKVGHHLLPRIDTLRSHLLLVKIGHCAIKIRSYSMYFLLYLNMYTCMYDTYLDTLIWRVVYIDTHIMYILSIYIRHESHETTWYTPKHSDTDVALDVVIHVQKHHCLPGVCWQFDSALEPTCRRCGWDSTHWFAGDHDNPQLCSGCVEADFKNCRTWTDVECEWICENRDAVWYCQ